jgi:hypothetical protein
MPYDSSASLHSGFASQSGGRPHLRSFWTAARSLILVSLYWSAVSWRTTAAFVSSPGEIANTEMPLSLRILARASRLVGPSPVGAVLS